MRILLASRSLPQHGSGGMEALAWSLIGRWAKSGHTIDVITTPGFRHDVEVPSGVEVVTLGERSRRYSRSWWRAAAEYYAANAGWDAVVSVSIAAASIAERGRGDGVPKVMQAHGSALDEARTKLRSGRPASMAASARNLARIVPDLRTYRRFDAVVAVGPAVERTLTGRPYRLPALGVCLRTIENGVDADALREARRHRQPTRTSFGFDDETFVVLYSGRIHRSKGVDRLVEAFALAAAARPDIPWKLVLAGDGPMLEALKTQVADGGLGRDVHLLGALGWADLAVLYGAGDLLVLPTLRDEGLPLSVLEARGAGVPCLVTTYANIPVDRVGCTGVLRDVNPSTIAEALIAAAAHREPCPSPLPREFSIDFTAAAYIDLFRSLAEGRA